MCACGTEIETAEHFFLRCHFNITQRLELFENLKKVDSNFFNLNEKDQVHVLLYGSLTNDSKCANQEIVKFVIAYVKTASRFDRSLITNENYIFVIFKILFFINMSCKLDTYLYLANFNLMIFLFVQFSNQPPIINTYLNISICLYSIHSKRLSCMNVGSCFCKCFILYVLNVL